MDGLRKCVILLMKGHAEEPSQMNGFLEDLRVHGVVPEVDSLGQGGEIPDPADTLLMTDDSALAGCFRDRGGAVIGVMEGAGVNDAWFPEADAVITSFADLTESFVRQIFCHAHHIPFTVAVTDHLILRESAGEDFAEISEMLHACAPEAFSDGLTADEVGNKERFLRYTRTAYAFFGYGLWTVVLRINDGRAVSACLPDEKDSTAKQQSGLAARRGGKSGQIVGWCGLFPVQDKSSDRYGLEMGYLVREDRRRQGIAYEACQAILRYAQEELGAHDLYLSAGTGNTASIMLARKLGFADLEEKDGVKIFHLPI